ncbi:MAG: LacI family DNA-binding transcriptional regulator [Eubacteriales bacterium]|nr:LacI family DNA-binding transcriptional regulator [Eubacteriales bacterium]
MNIIDVAREAGVSKTTVSRVLTNSKLVKPETKEKVLETIERLGFVPNTSAQKLAGNRNYVIGVINGVSINDPFYGYMDDRIAQECQKYGYGVIFTVVPEDAAGCDKEISMLYGKVDAYIILGDNQVLEKDAEKAVRMKVPIALFKTNIVKKGALSVDVDNEQGGYMAAQYLLSKGYKRIGYMHGSKSGDFREGNERCTGFLRGMQEVNQEIAANFYGTRAYSEAYQMTDEVIRSEIDALFCETDLMAYAVMQGLNEKRIPVPEKIAVLGFDNTKFTNYEVQTRLSTIGQPLEEMAAYIVESLINKIEKDLPYEKSRFFQTRIIVGETA